MWWVMASYDLAHQIRCAKHTFSGQCDITPMVCCSFGGHSTPQFLQCNMTCAVATIFSSLTFLSSSVSMTKLSLLVAASFSSPALLSYSVSKANLCCLLATTFSSLRFPSNSLSSPHFTLLRVARRCFSWFIFSHFCVLSSAFLSSVLQSLKLCLL